LYKIWGLRKDEADRIIPYARIDNSGVPSGRSNYSQNGVVSSQNPVLFDANTVTPEQLKLIPGIGSSLPYKIINFREKLGGFLYMLQLKETYGMTDSIFNSLLPYLHVLPTEIRKLNINTASEYELNAHPYIDKTLAKAITIYRNQHGGYKSVNDIRKIVFITEDVFNKIAPYLAVNLE
jgi:DNA uptake protein ComE-like DNA-binding protein